jgi:hypothetical protein
MSQIESFHLNNEHLTLSENSSFLSEQTQTISSLTLYTLYSSSTLSSTQSDCSSSTIDSNTYLSETSSSATLSESSVSLNLPSSISFSSNCPNVNPNINDTHCSNYGISSLASFDKDPLLSLLRHSSMGKYDGLSLRNSSFKIEDTKLKSLNLVGENNHSLLSNDEYVNLINDLINLKADLTKFRADLLLNELKIELAGLVEKIRIDLAEEFLGKFAKIEQGHSILSAKIKKLEIFLENEATYNNISCTPSADELTTSYTNDLTVSFLNSFELFIQIYFFVWIIF